MRYSDKRDLREKMYREYMSVGNKGDEFDNKDIIKKIVNIRLEIAQLMGFKNYAEYALESTQWLKTQRRRIQIIESVTRSL